MILTVTLNSALDKVIFIEEFVPTTDMRSQKAIESVGGKGFDSSVVLQALGVPTLALGIMAGFTGERLERLLQQYGIPADLVWVEGETRLANVIVETRRHRQSHVVTPGYRVTPADVNELTRRYQTHLPGADWVIASGSLPEGAPVDFYCTLAELAAAAGKPFLLDCSGEPMCRAAETKTAILKMNRAELAQAFGVQAETVAALAGRVREFRTARAVPAVVITCGMDGILASTPGGEYRASSPAQAEVNSAGCGDAVSATLAWRLCLGDTWPEALRWSAAVSAAVVLTERTAEVKVEDVARILPETRVVHLS